MRTLAVLQMANSSLPASIKAHLDLFLDSITPTSGDPTYSVLKAHLLFEELLRDSVLRCLAHPDELRGSRLTFAQLLSLARATSTTVEPDSWQWEAVAMLNKVRNLLAHHIDPPALTNKIGELTNFIVTSTGIPLPKGNDGSQTATSSHKYLAVDMALIALYGALATRLGFDSEARLSDQVNRSQQLVSRGSK